MCNHRPLKWWKWIGLSADWYPLTQEVGYESLINIRPRQNNRSMEIQDPVIREQVAQIVQQLLGGL